MTQNKTVQKVETIKVVEKKATEKFGKVADEIVKVLLAEKIKTRTQLAERVFEVFKLKYNGRHKRGEVRVERIQQQIGALFKCFNDWDGKGNPRNGWWEKYKVLETDEQIKLQERKKD